MATTITKHYNNEIKLKLSGFRIPYGFYKLSMNRTHDREGKISFSAWISCRMFNIPNNLADFCCDRSGRYEFYFSSYLLIRSTELGNCILLLMSKVVV
jgi:hypothetical protein